MPASPTRSLCWSPTQQRGRTLGQDFTSFCHLRNENESPLQSLGIVSFHPPCCRPHQDLLSSVSPRHHTPLQFLILSKPVAMPRIKSEHCHGAETHLTLVKNNVFLRLSSSTSRPTCLGCNSTELHYSRLKWAHLFNVAAKENSTSINTWTSVRLGTDNGPVVDDTLTENENYMCKSLHL